LVHVSAPAQTNGFSGLQNSLFKQPIKRKLPCDAIANGHLMTRAPKQATRDIDLT